MRVVIGGEDEVAFRLAEALMGAHEVVLVHGPDVPASRLERLDVETIQGPPSSPEVLGRARVGKADAFVACSVEDERNLVACLTAKRLGVARTVGFFHRREWLLPVDRGEASLAYAFGIDSVIWPAERLAKEIVRIVETPGALDVELFEDGRVQLLQYAVEAGSDMAGRTVREAGVPEGVVLVAVRRGGKLSLPRGDTRLEPGDRVFGMGDRAGVRRLAARLSGHRDSGGGDVLVVGGGSVGQIVAESLEAAGGFHLKLVESERARCAELASVLPRTLVLHGDGTDIDLLEAEGARDCRVLVAVTNRDEKNLLVSLLGKQIGVPRIVTRADSPANERLFEKVGIDVVRSARGSAIQAVIADLVGGKSRLLAEVEGGDARVLSTEVPADVPPTRLRDLRAPVFAIVAAIVRGDETIIPRGDDEIRGGDRVVVFCDRAGEPTAHAFFGRAKAAE
ncbi:MAG: Trk system potassium transporter TrkA [Planctomycetes bacterium]|nr:Trk system potassium transporter TrkA [Planctomycetota bacterium]